MGNYALYEIVLGICLVRMRRPADTIRVSFKHLGRCSSLKATSSPLWLDFWQHGMQADMHKHRGDLQQVWMTHTCLTRSIKNSAGVFQLLLYLWEYISTFHMLAKGHWKTCTLGARGNTTASPTSADLYMQCFFMNVCTGHKTTCVSNGHVE